MKITTKKLLMLTISFFLLEESVSDYTSATSTLLPCNMINRICFSFEIEKTVCHYAVRHNSMDENKSTFACFGR